MAASASFGLFSGSASYGQSQSSSNCGSGSSSSDANSYFSSLTQANFNLATTNINSYQQVGSTLPDTLACLQL